MIQIAVFGASGFGREVMPLARVHWARSVQPYELVFVDDNPGAKDCNGHRLLAYSDWIKRPSHSRFICIAVADGVSREKLAERCIRDDVDFFEVRAASALVHDDVLFGTGAILSAFVHLTSNIRVGVHFHANIYSYVAHDCVIGDFVTLAPRASVNGNVVIEDHAYIGTGAVIKQGRPGEPLVIGKGAVVGMGAVVTRSVPAGTTVVGNPAKPLFR